MVTSKIILDTRRGSPPYPLKLRLTHHRQSSYILLGISLHPEQWDGTVIKHPAAHQLNILITARKSQIDVQLMELSQRGLLVGKSIAQIRQMLDGDEQDDFIAYYRKAAGRRSVNTRSVYEQALRKILAFDAAPSFAKINIDWLTAFDRWMARTMPSANSRSIIMRCLRAVCNDALDDEIITRYPFRKFAIKQQPTKKKALSLSDVQTLISWEVEEYQQQYRDLFVLMIMMRGINIGDLCLLTEDNIDNGRILYSRQKTHKAYSIKIEPEIQEIIDRYRGERYLLDVMDRYSDYKDYLSRMNKALKSIGHVQHHKQGRKSKQPLFPELSTNWARHTFATIALNECSIPRDMVSDMMGHSVGLDVTNIYLKQDIDKMDAAARQVIDKILYNK